MSRHHDYKFSRKLTPYLKESVCLLEGCQNPVRFWISGPRYFCCREHRAEYSKGRPRGGAVAISLPTESGPHKIGS